jgi:hypothetical protein
MALERGVLQDLLIDPEGGPAARTAHLLLGAALRLPPNRQILLHDAVKSSFLRTVVKAAKKAGIAGSGI